MAGVGISDFVFTCPACKKNNQTEVLQAQSGTMYYRYDFATRNAGFEEVEFCADEITGYVCRECGNELPEKLKAEIDEKING